MKYTVIIVTVLVLLACGVGLFMNQSGSVYADTPPGDDGPYLNVRDFGATGDGKSDDTDAINAGIGAAYKSGKTLYLPAGTYLISKPIRFTGYGLRIIGDGHLDDVRGTIIKAAAKMPAMLYLRGAGVEVSRLYLDGNNKATFGLHAFHLNEVDSRLEFILIRNAISHGFFLDHSQISEVVNCISAGNGGDGFYITDCNAIRIAQCRSQANAGRGFTVTTTDYSGGCQLLDVNVEENGMEGVFVVRGGTSTLVVLQRAWIEGNNPGPPDKRPNQYDAVRIVGSNVVVTQCRIDTRGDEAPRPKYVINLVSETVLELTGVSGEFRVGEKVVGAKSGAVGTVSFWQTSPPWGDDYPMPDAYPRWLKRSKMLTLREVSGTFEAGESVRAGSTQAKGNIKSASAVSAKGCAISGNLLARSSVGPTAVDRVHEDPGCKNNVIENNRGIWGDGSERAVHRE